MKNVGRYPDLDTSLAHRRLSLDRLAEVSMTDEQVQQMLDGRVGDYVTPSQVTAETTSKLTKSALSTNASNYMDKSQIGSSYASLVNGTLPVSQRPDDPRVLYLESNAVIRSYGPTSTSSYSTTKVSCGTVTVPDPGYSWVPIIYGGCEVEFISGAPPAILTLEDSQGRVVAGGMSTRSTEVRFNRINISPEGTYHVGLTGQWTFTYKLRFASGSGQVRPTSSFGDITILIAPWTSKP